MSTSRSHEHVPTDDDRQLVKEFEQLQTSMGKGLQDLPDSLLVNIFLYATQYFVAEDPESSGVTRMHGVPRITLRSVCRRWRMISEAAICTILPDDVGYVTSELRSVQ